MSSSKYILFKSILFHSFYLDFCFEKQSTKTRIRCICWFMATFPNWCLAEKLEFNFYNWLISLELWKLKFSTSEQHQVGENCCIPWIKNWQSGKCFECFLAFCIKINRYRANGIWHSFEALYSKFSTCFQYFGSYSVSRNSQFLECLQKLGVSPEIGSFPVFRIAF